MQRIKTSTHFSHTDFNSPSGESNIRKQGEYVLKEILLKKEPKMTSRVIEFYQGISQQYCTPYAQKSCFNRRLDETKKTLAPLHTIKLAETHMDYSKLIPRKSKRGKTILLPKIIFPISNDIENKIILAQPFYPKLPTLTKQELLKTTQNFHATLDYYWEKTKVPLDLMGLTGFIRIARIIRNSGFNSNKLSQSLQKYWHEIFSNIRGNFPNYKGHNPSPQYVIIDPFPTFFSLGFGPIVPASPSAFYLYFAHKISLTLIEKALQPRPKSPIARITNSIFLVMLKQITLKIADSMCVEKC